MERQGETKSDVMDKMIEIRRYSHNDIDVWNRFVGESRNATFLFNRNYMDYHSDRFADASVMAYRKGKLCALLPANIDGDTLWTHQGLTYGGWIIPTSHFDANIMLELWDAFMDYCRTIGVKKVVYKPIPYIYSSIPSQEDLYALFRHNAVVKEVNLSSTIDMRNPIGVKMSKRQQLRKTEKIGLKITKSEDYKGFWRILEDCLQERHSSKPVHTCEEIMELATKFPNNISLYTISDDEGVQAGVCIFDTGIVAHSQYTATTEKARKYYYLTALYDYLINKEFRCRHYFDFGTSNEQHGRVLNAGLLNQKYSMGGTGVAYTVYEIQVG